MPINFTDSPANGATITQGNSTFIYNSTYGVWDRVISTSAISTYSTLANMPLSGVEDDTLAKVLDTNKLYKWTGTGWYFLDPVNNNPTITTAGDATYELAGDGTPTVVTLEANDPEGFAIIWSYAVTTGSLGATATVSQADNVFTITPSTDAANAGAFTITFTASDSVNLATSASEFTLAFGLSLVQYAAVADWSSINSPVNLSDGLGSFALSPYGQSTYSFFEDDTGSGITGNQWRKLGENGTTTDNLPGHVWIPVNFWDRIATDGAYIQLQYGNTLYSNSQHRGFAMFVGASPSTYPVAGTSSDIAGAPEVFRLTDIDGQKIAGFVDGVWGGSAGVISNPSGNTITEATSQGSMHIVVYVNKDTGVLKFWYSRRDYGPWIYMGEHVFTEAQRTQIQGLWMGSVYRNYNNQAHIKLTNAEAFPAGLLT